MAPKPRLILASGSRYKRELLERLGVPFDARDADIDEVRAHDESPRELARRLAREKAEAVASQQPGALVLGADQVIALGDEVFSKPGTPERARRQLARLAGQTHRLISAVALVGARGVLSVQDVQFDMTMRPLTPRRIADYVDADSPLDCAGSYRVESLGISLFESMRGDDYTAIVGLPLTRVWGMLHAEGFFDAATGT